MVGMLSKTLIFYDAVTTAGLARSNTQEVDLVRWSVTEERLYEE